MASISDILIAKRWILNGDSLENLILKLFNEYTSWN
jgi:hypothetical protein